MISKERFLQVLNQIPFWVRTYKQETDYIKQLNYRIIQLEEENSTLIKHLKKNVAEHHFKKIFDEIDEEFKIIERWNENETPSAQIRTE